MILHGKLRQEFRQFTGQYREGLLPPTNMDANIETLISDVLFSKHPNRKSPALEAFHPYFSSPSLIDLDIMSYIVDRVPKTIKGDRTMTNWNI